MKHLLLLAEKLGIKFDAAEPDEEKISGEVAAKAAELLAENAKLKESAAAEKTKVDLLTDRLNALAAERAAEKVSELLGDALRRGKITPAQKEHYRKLAEYDFSAVKALFDALSDGAAVPITALGVTGEAEQNTEVFSEEKYHAIAQKHIATGINEIDAYKRAYREVLK